MSYTLSDFRARQRKHDARKRRIIMTLMLSIGMISFTIGFVVGVLLAPERVKVERVKVDHCSDYDQIANY